MAQLDIFLGPEVLMVQTVGAFFFLKKNLIENPKSTINKQILFFFFFILGISQMSSQVTENCNVSEIQFKLTEERNLGKNWDSDLALSQFR